MRKIIAFLVFLVALAILLAAGCGSRLTTVAKIRQRAIGRSFAYCRVILPRFADIAADVREVEVRQVWTEGAEAGLPLREHPDCLLLPADGVAFSDCEIVLPFGAKVAINVQVNRRARGDYCQPLEVLCDSEKLKTRVERFGGTSFCWHAID